MKRIAFVFASVILLVSILTGCGGSPTATQAPADSQAPAAPATEAPASSGSDEIVIQHWYHQYGEEGTYEAALRYAEEYSKATPGVRVEVTWVPGDYAAALNAALLTDEGPDVFELQNVTLDRVAAEQLAPLDDLFTGVLEDFNKAAMERVVVDGTIYGVPMIVDPQFVYYRKSMFANAGIEAPKTMDELIAASNALSDGRVKGIYLSNDLGSTNYLLYMKTLAANTEFIKDGKVVINTPDNVRMWQKTKELADSGSMLVGATTEWWDPGALNDGLVAMQWCGLWAMPGVVSALGPDEVGVMPWPAIDENATPSIWLGGWNQSVNAKSANVEAAKAYVKWLWIENTEVQLDWNLSYGFHIPPRTSTAIKSDKLQTGPAAEVLAMLPKYGKTTPITWTGAMDTIYSDAHSAVLLKGADPAEQLAAAAVAAQAELDALLK